MGEIKGIIQEWSVTTSKLGQIVVNNVVYPNLSESTSVNMAVGDHHIGLKKKYNKKNQMVYGCVILEEKNLCCAVPLNRIHKMTKKHLQIWDEDDHLVTLPFAGVWAVRHDDYWNVHVNWNLAAENPSLEWM